MPLQYWSSLFFHINKHSLTKKLQCNDVSTDCSRRVPRKNTQTQCSWTYRPRETNRSSWLLKPVESFEVRRPSSETTRSFTRLIIEACEQIRGASFKALPLPFVAETMVSFSQMTRTKVSIQKPVLTEESQVRCNAENACNIRNSLSYCILIKFLAHIIARQLSNYDVDNWSNF